MLLTSCDVQHSPYKKKIIWLKAAANSETQKLCLVLAAHLDSFSSSVNVPHELW